MSIIQKVKWRVKLGDFIIVPSSFVLTLPMMVQGFTMNSLIFVYSLLFPLLGKAEILSLSKVYLP